MRFVLKAAGIGLMTLAAQVAIDLTTAAVTFPRFDPAAGFDAPEAERVRDAEATIRRMCVPARWMIHAYIGF